MRPRTQAQAASARVDRAASWRRARPRRSRRDRPDRARCAGFTVVEVAIALGLAALLAGLAYPAFQDWIGELRLDNHARHLAESMMRARTEAVRRGHRVALCKSSDRRHCDGSARWEDGFVMFADVDGDGRVGAAEALIEIGARAPAGITVSANRPVENYVSYTSLGRARMLDGALQMGTLALCRRGHRALHVVLAASGRARIERTQDRCP